MGTFAIEAATSTTASTPNPTSSTATAPIEAREILRCGICRLTQFRTLNNLCRRCHAPLETEEETEPTATAPVKEGIMPNDDDVDVARSVRELRKGKGLSQRQFAGILKVPRTYISRIENGKLLPTLGNLERIAGALQLKVEALLETTASRRAQKVTTVLGDPFIGELIEAGIGRLDGFQRSMFLNHVREMARGEKAAES